jgi:hypothetical protein
MERSEIEMKNSAERLGWVDEIQAWLRFDVNDIRTLEDDW